jgi:hypothetical protein
MLDIREKIINDFKKYKITQLQLDPFGFCNAGCWFCPVKYMGNPEDGKKTMSVELLEKIIENLIEEREKPDGLVSKSFGGFYTAHYNEILLYKHFKDLLEICRKHKLQFMVLSNGVPLTPQKTDLIKEYADVVNGICLNIPAFEEEIWEKRAGMPRSQFNRLINNIHYAREKLDYMVKSGAFSIQINGATTQSFEEAGGWITKGPDFPEDMDLDPINGELARQKKIAEELFPGHNIFSMPSLIDRAGLLKTVISNKNSITRNLQNNDESKRVVGCRNGFEVGGRPFGWIHINAAGEAFLCCNDYDFHFKFGDFKTQNLRDFWGGEKHIHTVERSFETICRNCASAIFE